MPSAPPAVPGATYRLQLGGDVDFDAAADLAGYLADLGVTHLYTSPYLQAAAGSTHGYDCVDPTSVSEELGGDAGRARLLVALRRAGLGHVIDIVPNHLGIADPRNRWWFDVLRHGRASQFADVFDIDWEATDDGRVLLPILARPVDDELALGTIALERGESDAVLRCGDTVLPLAPGSAGLPDADGTEALRAVLDRQHYVLVPWQVGLERLDHRRFFDITTLAGVRVEDPRVFAAVHRLVLDWVRDGNVDAIRVDHVDGLADPTGYLARLAEATGPLTCWVEKILAGDEQLDARWPVAGTTGYDALAELTDLLVDGRGIEAIGAAYERITGSSTSWEETAREARTQVVRELLHPEVRRCAAALGAAARERGVEVTDEQAGAVVEAFAVELPVYRTYVWPDRTVTAQDRTVIDNALGAVATHHPAVTGPATTVLAEALRHPRARDTDLVRTLQQLTGAAMAKGVEDTAFYRDVRFVACNEVGGGPDRHGCDVATFHRRAARRAERWPAAMVTTSTHDTKRSEDVRARLAVLSEIPERWAAALTAWCARTARWWQDGVEPDRALDVLIHQTVVGAHPLPAPRAHRFLEKAMREAKQRTSWLQPDATFEAAAHAVLDRVLADDIHRREVDELAGDLLVPGRINALAQKLLALTMPGVPDVYQGSELWNLDLVDPDNRRPIDTTLHRRLLAELPRTPGVEDARRWAESLADPDDPGIAKLAVVHHGLRTRREHHACFIGPGAVYVPITADGPAADHAVVFRRGADVLTAVTRHSVGLAATGGWRDTSFVLPDGTWRAVLSGRRFRGAIAVADIFAELPVSLLVRT